MLSSMILPERFSGPVFRAYAWIMGSMADLESFWEPAHPRFGVLEWLEVVGGQLPQVGP